MIRIRKYIAKMARAVAVCLVICFVTAFGVKFLGSDSDSLLKKCSEQMMNDLGNRVIKMHAPVLTYTVSPPEEKSLWDLVTGRIMNFFPIYEYTSTQPQYETQVESAISYEKIVAQEAADENYVDDKTGEIITDHAGEGDEGQPKPEKQPKNGNLKEDEAKAVSLEKLNDFDYLIQKFYIIDSTTTIKSSQLKAEKLLAKDLTVDKNKKGPQILVYHTHSQEGYLDSKRKGSKASVVAIGDYLTELLEEKYGFEVLHHKGEYDVKERDSAYSTALPNVEQVLKENPSIKIVLDLHRDAVSKDARLMTEIDGKDTAKIMFFNGLSRTTANGPIPYLRNDNLQDNLAFSLQMQIAAATYYPGFTRPIYLKGYRYNMHLKPRTLLVEVGAQTNTYMEAKNAMEPLADLLSKVLTSQGE